MTYSQMLELKFNRKKVHLAITIWKESGCDEMRAFMPLCDALMQECGMNKGDAIIDTKSLIAKLKTIKVRE